MMMTTSTKMTMVDPGNNGASRALGVSRGYEGNREAADYDNDDDDDDDDDGEKDADNGGEDADNGDEDDDDDNE